MIPLLATAFAADVVVEGSAPVQNGDFGRARELAMRRALAQAAEMQSSRVSSQTLLHDGVLTESAQVSSSACTENAHVVGEVVGQDELTLRVAVSVREAGECHQTCRQATVNRVVIAGFPLEHPEQILPTENSWLMNWTPAELARWIDKRRQLLVVHDAGAFPHSSPARAPDPYLIPADTETPFAALARHHRAQYVVAGVYRNFGLRDNGILGKRRHIEIEAFIHDGVSGSVVGRKTFTGLAEGQVSMRPKPPIGTAEFYASDLGRVWGRVMNELADWLTAKITCLPFMARVLKVEGSRIYLDAGADAGLSVGDTFVLHTWRRPSATVVTEYQVFLGQEKLSRATVTIRSRYPAFSIAEVTGTRQDIQISPGDLLYAR